MSQRTIRRRKFIALATKAAVVAGVAPVICRAQPGAEGANAKLDLACIGLGGRMQGLIKEALACQANIVALCDVDAARIESTRKAFSASLEKAQVYRDYRELFAHEKSLDAVVIGTPDHWHAAICSAAFRAGKHVYCEKPLAHTVGEARLIAGLVKQSRLVTQTGNQGSASGNFRRSIELIKAGVLGSVSEVHAWLPRHVRPSGEDRLAGEDPVPAGLDWDFWLGPAPVRPYKRGLYHPAQWRRWYDFGGGALSDFCCHAFSMPVRALDLDYPKPIQVSGAEMGKESFPDSCKVHFSFPARAGRGPVSIYFYTGGDLLPSEVTAGVAETFGKVGDTGCLLRGTKGTLSAGLWNNECFLRLEGEKEFTAAASHPAAAAVPRSLPRAPSEKHMLEWLEACKGGPKTFSPFEIGAHITEIGAAGVVALRLGRDLDWDGIAMRAAGVPEAEALVKPQHRKEWGC